MEKGDELILFSRVAKLCGVTQLWLDGIHFQEPGCLTALQQLRLLELGFMDCSGIVEALRQPDAFPHLQKLCIIEADSDVADFEEAEERANLREEVHNMSKAIFKLPSLIELSGRCRLFSLPAPDMWKLWSRPDPEFTSVRQVWRKVL